MKATAWRGSGRAGTGLGVHELARDATLRLRPGRARLAVQVRDGCVLVTREGDAEDHVLGPGDELGLAGGGLAVAWALSTARLTVALAASGTLARTPREKALAGA